MKVKTYNCPDCGASLNIEENTKHVYCNYCGGQVTVQSEEIVIKHLEPGDITEEQEYINAETNLKLKNYTEAYKGYKSLSKRYVNDPVVWIGLLRSCSNDFTRDCYESYYRSELVKFWEAFSSLAPEEEINKYKKQYEEYIEQVDRICEAIRINQEQHPSNNSLVNAYYNNPLIKLIITMFVGSLGIHKFIERNYKDGFLYFFTCGGFCILWFLDTIFAFMDFIKYKKSR